MSDRTTVGFIGTGVMGASMAGHLIDAGFDVRVYSRTMSKTAPLVERGAKAAASPAQIAAECDMVFSIVGFPTDVEEIYLGEGGLVANAKAGALLVDMTTSSPKLAREIHARATERGLSSLDAPVTGGDRGAREGTLTILVGGSEADLARAMPCFEAMGKKVRLMGGPGAGQTAKLANQIAICGSMTGLCEALKFADANGLDLSMLIDTIGSGAAGSWSMTNLAPRIIGNDFAPGFFVKHYIKDLRLAEEAASASGCCDLPALDLTLKLYEELAAKGHGDDGTQALYKIYGH